MKFRYIKYFDYIIALASYFFLSFLILGGFIFSHGTIGFFHDWFLGPFEEMNEYWAKNGPYAWDPQIGNKVYYTDWLFRLILSALPSSFLGGEALSKGLLILSITLSGFGAYSLGKRLKLGPYVSFATGLLYVFSPIIFTRIVAGYIYYLIAYFLSPLIVEVFLRGKEEKKNRYFIIAGLLLSIATIQIQFLPMMFLVLVIFSLVDYRRIKKSIVGLFIILAITFLTILSPLILSQLALKSNEIPFNPNQLLSYFTVASASDLAKSFRMLGYEGMPYSYLNLGTTKDILSSNMGIIPSWIFYLDFLLPIIGFSVLFFRRDKYAISFAIISVIGLYLLKGTNAPFAGFFIFLFTHGLYVFRELWHLAFLYGFSITFLVAFFIERLVRLKFSPFVKVPIAVALISMIILSNGYPLLLGNFAGYLQAYDFPKEYHTLYNKLLSNPNYNVLILPYTNPIRYDNSRLQGLDPLITDNPSVIFPTILGNRGSPILSSSTWLLSAMQENMTHNLGKLLSGYGIKYIILRKDFVSNYPNYTPLGDIPSFRVKWYNSLQPLLDSQKDLKIVSNTSQYSIYENLNNATKVFTPSISAGGLTNFDSLLWISNLTSLSNVAVYPSVSNNNSINFVDTREESNLSGTDFIDFGRYASTFNAMDGWTTKTDAFGYDHLLASRLNNGLFSASPDSVVSFEMPSKYHNKQIEMWIKALTWNQGGLTNIEINGREYPLSLFSPNATLQTFKIFTGEMVNPFHVSIKNIKGKNYIEGAYVKENSQELKEVNKVVVIDPRSQNKTNMILNPDFTILDKSKKPLVLPSYWHDRRDSCIRYFICVQNNTDGWKDNTSLSFTAKNSTNQTNQKWSSIYGQQIIVKPAEHYEIVTHMKMSRLATQSHVALEGRNETSRHWYQLAQCPLGTNGPLEWQEFTCSIIIPDNMTKVRPVLNAGWSSQPNENATTWFDAIYLNKITDEKQSPNIGKIDRLISGVVEGNKSSLITQTSSTVNGYNKVNPTLWKLNVNIAGPTTIGFAEPYDQAWNAIIYKDGKKIDTVRSMPLYGAINSFKVKQTGNLQIDLDFAPQHWYYIGFIISALTYAFCIFFIIYDWRRDRTSRLAAINKEVHRDF